MDRRLCEKRKELQKSCAILGLSLRDATCKETVAKRVKEMHPDHGGGSSVDHDEVGKARNYIKKCWKSPNKHFLFRSDYSEPSSRTTLLNKIYGMEQEIFKLRASTLAFANAKQALADAEQEKQLLRAENADQALALANAKQALADAEQEKQELRAENAGQALALANVKKENLKLSAELQSRNGEEHTQACTLRLPVPQQEFLQRILQDGWAIKQRKRRKGNRCDKFYHSPSGQVFRSKVAVERHYDAGKPANPF